jgi:hypothetical protein
MKARGGWTMLPAEVWELLMNWLTLLVYIMTSVTVAGILVVAALTAGLAWKTMIILALLGFVVAIPISLMVGKRIA